MKVIIEIKDFKEPLDVARYFYSMCLLNPELDAFAVEIEGKDIRMVRKQ